MSPKVGIVGRIVLALLAVGGVSTGSSIYLLHETHLQRERDHLQDEVRIVSNLIASVAAFDRKFSASDHPDGALAATLDQTREAFDSQDGLSAAGELILFRRASGDRFVAIVHQNIDGRREAREHDEEVFLGTPYGEALAKGFQGATGTARFQSRIGEDILIAYAPVKGTDLLTVAEVRVSDVNAPFIQTILIVILIATVVGLLGTVVARREAVNVVDALDSERKKLKDFADSASDWLWVQDENFRYVSVDDSARPHTQLRVEQVLGMRREDSADESTSTEKWLQLREKLKNREPFKNFVYRARSKDGERVALSASGVPVFDNSGRFRGYRGTATDVTERLDRAQKLADAEERTRVAFDSMTVGVIEISRHGGIEAFNPKAEQMFGYRAEEVLGKNVSMLMPQRYARDHDGFIKHFVETGEKKIIGTGREVSGLTKNGDEIPIHLGVAEMNVGNEQRFIGSLTDLSTQKSLETMLRRSTKLDAIGQLSGGIAHDFNNLLGIVLGNLELIQRKLEPDSRLFQQVEKAIGAAKRGAGLTRKLLDFSRQAPEAQQLDIVDTTEIISGLEDLIGRSLSANIEVKTDLTEDAPPVECDRSDLEDAIINLVMNAKDAMPKGGRIRIANSARTVEPGERLALAGLAPGQYTQIDISDSGSGMSRETLDQIFDPFFTTKPAGKGTGLGLPMVYAFAKRSGGHILAYSEQGTGSSFKLYLPSHTGTGTGSRIGDRADDTETIRGGTETILVVDDEEGLLDIARSVLEERGYSVRTAVSPAAALEILNGDGEIDLIFSDFIMAGEMNGIELIEKAAEIRPRVKKLLTSGFTGHAFNPEEAQHWAAKLIAKPYSNRTLATAVRAALDEEISS
ncbi:PAS domain S-box protein [Nisaea acidiphila]|uniref:Sensor protein FixL n=1 Tax=Nisaea acidiphila TaxID=1862145 RepID=A0A9J7AN42_9PROT|nr:PAS domain-containing sensor histidine kinase [Nisaea acidiphila]UUX48864.1 PAS domain S-box protein [Nisaea acidiphila]